MKQGWGIAFSGGGQRGFAHVGVIRALEEFGVEPVAIAGTSAGSIFGGLWACGKTAEEMTVWSRQLETRKLLDFYFSLPHLLKGILERSVAILTRQLVTCRQEDADIVILPTLPPVTIGDFRHNELLLESGYQQACSALSAYFQGPIVPCHFR